MAVITLMNAILCQIFYCRDSITPPVTFKMVSDDVSFLWLVRSIPFMDVVVVGWNPIPYTLVGDMLSDH